MVDISLIDDMIPTTISTEPIME